jgi:putative DNA primase/helicase
VYNNDLYLWVLRWLAIPFQKPGTKLDTALIFHGHIQGAGKSLFFDRIMRRVYGEYAVTLGQGQLESSYNDWVAGKLYTVFEEIFTGQDRYKHMGFVKQLVTGDQIYISKKFVSGWKEDNYVNTVFLSNDMMPLSLEVNDRRHVVSYPKAKIEATLLKRVEVAVNDPDSDMVSAFYTYLLNVSLAGQNEHTPAIMTKAKQQLIKLSQTS